MACCDVPWTRAAWFAAVVALAAGADRLTKDVVFQWRGQPGAREPYWIWPEYVGIETATNPGALFGLGAGNSHIFAALSVAAIIGIVFWLFVRGAARDPFLTLALALVTSGVIGNLCDRLGWWTPPWAPDQSIREVRDWILFRYGRYTWPNFNLADSFLVVGAGLIMLQAFLAKDEPTTSSATAAEPAAEPESSARPV